MDISEDKNVFVNDHIKTNVIWIPKTPSKPEVFQINNSSDIQFDEIIAINAIYGSIKIHNFERKLIEKRSEFINDQIEYSPEVENFFSEKDEVDIKIIFIPVQEYFEEKIERSKYLTDLTYENSEFTVYSLVLLKNISETLPFKNRRYWRITHVYARLTVFYDSRYPLNNPGLLFEFSLELPESINLKLCEEIKQILVNRNADQECIFQVVNFLEVILDDLCDHLQISEDLWEQMRRLNNQREFERHFDNSLIVEGDQIDILRQVHEYKGIDDTSIDVNNDMLNNIEISENIFNSFDSKDQLNSEIVGNFSKSFKFKGRSYSKDIIDMGPGFLDDTILEYPSKNVINDEIGETKSLNETKFLINADFSNNLFQYLTERNKLLLSSKRFNQDFRVLGIIFSSEDMVVTKSLHLIDQNCYQVSIYRISSNRFNKVFDKILSKVSSLVMLQHRYMVRYYQCWVEENFDPEDNDFVLFYVQTEFMNNNSTLFDYLHKGKITNREVHVIWSLFRQILEILSYCHQNGVSHNALSSKCIYIDEDIYGYSIKLSDFIFGSHLDYFTGEESSQDFEFPGIFPEDIQLLDMRKQDIYCTGKIFCEMWLRIKYGNNDYDYLLHKLLNWLENTKITSELHFSEFNQVILDTTKSIEEIFNFTSDIPTEFKYIPKSALLILKKLLYENNQINSVDELLKCDLLPNSIDKNEFKYYLSRICNSKTHESRITLNTLFNRCIDRISSAAFLFDIQKDEQINMIDLTFSDIVKTSITEILHNHDFILWKLPILYPVQFLSENINNSDFDKLLYDCKLRMRKPHLLLDVSNNLLFLPNSAPFCMMCSLLSLFVNFELNNHQYFDNYMEDSTINTNNLDKGCNSSTHAMKNNRDYSINNNINGNSNSNTININKDCYFNFNFQLETPIQRYALFPIYEQPINVREKVFGPPKSSLSLAFDIIYQLNDTEFNDFTKSSATEKHSEQNYRLIDNLMVELEGLLLSLKLIIPWLDYLEDEPLIRITFPPLVTCIFNEIINCMMKKQNDTENLKLLKDNLFLNKDNIQDHYLKDLLLQKYEFEWVFDTKTNGYRLKNMYENGFIQKIQKYLDDNNSKIRLYISLMNEVLNILSESTELLIYKEKKIKLFFDPLMEYDVNLYDFNSILYCINSLNNGNKIIYSIGGSYSHKINNTLGFFSNSHLTEEKSSHSVKSYNSINCVLGEIAIELIINQVCEKAKKYRTEFVNTGGYINGVSIFGIPSINSNQNNEMSELSRNLLLKPISLLKSCYPRVIVMTQKNKLQPKVLSLTKRLWQIGIRSEYRLTPVQSLSTFLEKLKRDTLIELLIIVMNLNKTINNNNFEDEKEFVEKNNSIDNNNVNFSPLEKDNKDYSDNNEEQSSNTNTEVCRNKPVSYRIEPIAGLYYEGNTSQNTKIIMENEESVINYVINKRKKQIID